MDEEMHLFCVIDVNCPPVELKRTKDSFSCSFDVKEPLPGFLLLFSQGKWLDSAENLCLEASLIVNNKCQEFGFLSKNNKSILKEVNLDSLSKKKCQARLEVKPTIPCSSKTSAEKKSKTKDASVDTEPKEHQEEIGNESGEITKIKNSSKEDIYQKEKKLTPCDKQKITLLEKMSLRKDRNLKEVENLRDPKESEISCNENGITNSEDSKLSLDCKKLKNKGSKKVGSKISKEVTPEESQILDLHMKEIKENVPKTKSNKVLGITRSLRSSNSSKKKNGKDQQDRKECSVIEEDKVTEEPKSKDEDLSKVDDHKQVLKKKADKSKVEKEHKEELVKENKSSKNLDSKTSRKSKVKKQTQSTTKNGTDDSREGSIGISKSDNIVEENGKKEVPSSGVKEVKSQEDLTEKKQTPNCGIKKDNLQKKTSSISKVVNLTMVKSEAKNKESLKKKRSTKSKISKDTVKTKQTTLQFNTLAFAGDAKEKSILKEGGTPSKKRKLSVSFGNRSAENKPKEPELPNDVVKESKSKLDHSPKRRKTKIDIESEAPLKDTEALMKISASEKDIEYKNDQKENTTESLKTPHIKNSCKTPSPPKPPQKSKNKRVTYEGTPDSGSTPKKRSPKRVRTLKNEFTKSILLKESNKKCPAMCKDVTDRSCHPSERWGPTLSMVGSNKAILVGGQGEKQVFNKDSVWSLNPETRKWKQLETKSEGPRPDLRMGHTATYDPTVRCIYVYGGSKNLKWYNDVHALDVDEKLWQLVKVTGKAPTRAYHTACLYRHEIWVFGGVYPKPDPQPDGCSNEIHVFSPILGHWYMPTVTGEKPAARSGHSATIIKEKMVVFGGWDFPYCFNDIYVLDLNLIDWRKPEMKGAPPKPRSWHASCALSHSRVLIHGGYDGDIALDDIHIFDVATMCWMEILLTSSPVPRVGHSCLCLPFTSANEEDDEILIFGGGDNEKKFFGDLFSISVPFKPAIKTNENLNGDLNSNQTLTVS